MTYIPHSTFDDEPRFIVAITKLINEGSLPKMKEWEKGVKDEKARLVRRKAGEKEAKEAEAMAKELGVWDEFYGSGKVGERKSKSKAKGKETKNNNDEEEDMSALQALILKKREKKAVDTNAFFDGLLAKYGGQGKQSGRGEKRGREEGDEGEISDEEFAKLQEKLFGDIPKTSKSTSPPSKGKSTKKRRKGTTK